MRRLILFFISFAAILSSCEKEKAVPIEKFKGCVVLQYPIVGNFSTEKYLRIKNKDSVFYIYAHEFDTKNLKPGDTL